MNLEAPWVTNPTAYEDKDEYTYEDYLADKADDDYKWEKELELIKESLEEIREE